MSEWKSILTAPKDGREILLASHDWVGSGRFRNGFMGWGFYFSSDSLSLTAIYWQELPPPPDRLNPPPSSDPNE